MPLNQAHEGYEYQDLLTAYFVLQEILDEQDSQFCIDKKEFVADKFDDLTFTNKHGTFKRQIKYSNENSTHMLEKKDISANSSYDLALDSLYSSWLKHPTNSSFDIRLCLAWDEPTDELKDILCLSPKKATFLNHKTNILKINIEKLWPKNGSPLKSWRKLNAASKTINRDSFCKFCEDFVLELNFPKFSLDIYNPGILESIVLEQVNKVGIGIYPNNDWKPEEFVLALLNLIKRSRSKNTTITTKQIFSNFHIKTDYGCIKQCFPIDYSKNIKLSFFVKVLIKELYNKKKIILTGEPGSGKSWLVDNLISALMTSNTKVIRHYCYVDLVDEFQKERIKLNVFYGNLIADILKAFPNLKEKKQAKYASSLTELNILLQSIDEPTVLIIDGIDHINRIFHYRSYPDISNDEIKIIEAINKLQPSDNVQVLVTSQPVSDLKKINNYFEEIIPGWTIEEITQLMKRMHLEDISIDNKLLSEYLLDKSNGNPLYLNYLIDEIKKISNICLSELQKLPAYTFNLSTYYEYLITKLNTKENVPQILSGVNFSLSKSELIEITGLGNYVEESLELISPVIKLNASQSGFVIYHESFRRFVIDKLILNNVSIEQVVFKPLIDWFEKKGFYNYPKAYRYYLQTLYDGNYFDKIAEYITHTYVTESVFYGYSWELISKNYYCLRAAGLFLKDFPKIILLNEISKLLSSTEDAYNESFQLYFNSLGHLRGFKTVADYLSFEGKSTLPLRNGLEACYLCNLNKMNAPWDIYSGYFKKGEGIKLEDFSYYIKCHLAQFNLAAIISMCHSVRDKNLIEYENVLRKELVKHDNIEIIEILIKSDPIISSIINFRINSHSQINQDLKKIANTIIKINHISDQEASEINIFLTQVKLQISNNILIDEIIAMLREKNWFYNWLIYCIKIYQINILGATASKQIKEAFSQLILDTEPFKGELRACDLYSIRDLIYSTINEGLILIGDDSQCWTCVIDTLVILSNDTTTSIQKSLNGPLSTDKLFKILEENARTENIEYIKTVLEDQIEDKKNYNLHSYIADFCFRLSTLYSISGDSNNAELLFRKGVVFLLGYTMRRDLTIEELLESINSVTNLDKDYGLLYIKQIKSLVDSVVEHTDGKDTKHFPVEWFDKFIEIDMNESEKCLCYQLINARYDWRLEDSLRHFLISANGNINPIVELFIAKTFIAESSESFLSYFIDLCDKVNPVDSELAKISLSLVKASTKTEKPPQYTDEFIIKLNKKCKDLGIHSEKQNSTIKFKEFSSSNPEIKDVSKEPIQRKIFADMTVGELQDYIKENKLRNTEINSLTYVFSNYSILTPELKEIISILIKKNTEYDTSPDIDLDILFHNDTEISIYYWVARFVYDRSGWFENLINVKAFEKAYSINNTLAVQYFSELLSDILNIGFNRQVSANLINTFVKIKYDTAIVKEMWSNLYEMIDYRLPVKNDFNWDEALLNKLEMNYEEILICILFARFKVNTSERFHTTLCAISYLLNHYPQKLIKPIKWFLENQDQFLKSVLLCILELLYNYKKVNSNYHNEFTEELHKLHPQKYYLINFILEDLLSLPKWKFIVNSPRIIYPVDSGFAEFFMDLNIRHPKIKQAGMDIENLFGKYKETFSKRYTENTELYYNRLHETSVKHIYSSDYILELINTYFYPELNSFMNQEDVFNSIKIEIQLLIVQELSRTIRSDNLKKPSQWEDGCSKINIDDKYDWIRIAHFEIELQELDRYKFKKVVVYGGLTFTEKDYIFPFSGERLLPENILSPLVGCVEKEECTIVSFVQSYDALENYKLLWLNSYLVITLDLTTDDLNNGLSAKNKEGATVLKYKCWYSDYVGNGGRSGIDDEIPKLDGAELFIRKDYYKKICDLFNTEPSYNTFKINQK